jgi:hypothetical protein
MLFVGALACAATAKEISVDFGATATALDFVWGVDSKRGPRCGDFDGSPGADVSDALHAMGSTLIRTHDADAIDWPLVYPHPALDGKHPTDDPSSYEWAAADAYFESLVGGGFEPYVRLGTSYGQLAGGLPAAGAPYNRSALVDVLLHTVMHFNDGWGAAAGGANFTAGAVRFVELWNEPDTTCAFDLVAAPGCGRFWNRSAADFYDLVDDAARALKRYDPTLRVGACGVAVYNQGEGAAAPLGDNPFAFPLIAELGRRGTPLDFFSWHGYVDRPQWYADAAGRLRAALDAAWPARTVASHVTEFFPCVLCSEQDTATGAASLAASLTKMVQSGVAVATMYPLCDNNGNRTTRGWGLFDEVSVPGAATWRPLTHAVALFGELAQTAPALLPATASLPEEAPFFTVLAGRGAGAAGGGVLKALVAAQKSSCDIVDFAVSGLDCGGAAWQWSVVVVNGTHTTPTAVAGGVAQPVDGALTMRFPLAAPAVALLRLRKVAA